MMKRKEGNREGRRNMDRVRGSLDSSEDCHDQILYRHKREREREREQK